MKCPGSMHVGRKHEVSGRPECERKLLGCYMQASQRPRPLRNSPLIHLARSRPTGHPRAGARLQQAQQRALEVKREQRDKGSGSRAARARTTGHWRAGARLQRAQQRAVEVQWEQRVDDLHRVLLEDEARVKVRGVRRPLRAGFRVRVHGLGSPDSGLCTGSCSSPGPTSKFSLPLALSTSDLGLGKATQHLLRVGLAPIAMQAC